MSDKQGIVLGSGSAQGIPPIFGRNKFYDWIRETKGKEFRTRTSMMLNKNILIDASPDLYVQMFDNDVTLYDVEHLFFTHSHNDHFNAFEFVDCVIMTAEVAADVPKRPLNIYLSRPAHEWLFNTYLPVFKQYINEERLAELAKYVTFHPVDYEKSFKVGDMTVYPGRGMHRAYGENENSINYIFENVNGKNYMCAWDTGLYKQETLDYFGSTGVKVDTLIMEGSFGKDKSRGGPGDGHLNFYTYMEQVKNLESKGVLDQNSQLLLMHLTCFIHEKHDDICQWFAERDPRVVITYDGMKF